jgi:uncharacterized membrane protein
VNLDTTIFILTLLEALFIAGMFLLYPRIARRGLLFGVYVGEERSGGEKARQITRSWQVGIVLWTIASVGLGLAVFARFRTPMAAVVAPLLLVVGYVVLYLRAYFRARAMAVEGPPAAVAVLDVAEAPSMLPLFVLALGIIGGTFAISYAAMHYNDLPARVPTHFGLSGKPDAWRPKSFWTVMLLPLFTLIMGVGMAGVAFLVARAKRAVRFPQTHISLEAQRRFRQAMTRFLSVLAVIVTGMLMTMSIDSIRVGLGLAEGLSPVGMALGIGIAVLALVGTLYFICRYGQGGARLERAAGNAPLTNGLADNRYWVLGAFYVNKEDPSIFVERRFGFGYTINFGNWKAVAFLVVFIGTILALAVVGVLKG